MYLVPVRPARDTKGRMWPVGCSLPRSVLHYIIYYRPLSELRIAGIQ